MLSDLTVTDWDTMTGVQSSINQMDLTGKDIAVVFCVLVKPLVTRHSVVMTFSFIHTKDLVRVHTVCIRHFGCC